jgi:putative DNA methylase
MRARIPDRAQAIRPLAYRLCTLCERKGRAEDARAYNESVAAWSSIPQASEDAGIIGSQKQLNI